MLVVFHRNMGHAVKAAKCILATDTSFNARRKDCPQHHAIWRSRALLSAITLSLPCLCGWGAEQDQEFRFWILECFTLWTQRVKTCWHCNCWSWSAWHSCSQSCRVLKSKVTEMGCATVSQAATTVWSQQCGQQCCKHAVDVTDWRNKCQRPQLCQRWHPGCPGENVVLCIFDIGYRNLIL